MSQPINIPGRRRSITNRASSFGKSESPYFNTIPPTENYTNIELFKTLKTTVKPAQVFNLTNFFKGLNANQYVSTVKRDSFIPIQNPGGGEYTHKIDFQYNRNFLSLYTDFILSIPGKVNRITVLLNDCTVYDETHEITVETFGFFLSRPNVLPMVCQNLLKFKLTIWVWATQAPKLIYTEIKTKPDITLILNILQQWYIKDGENTLCFYDVDDPEIVDNTWEWLCNIPLINSLQLGD